MKQILLAVQALARAGNPSVEDPYFSVSKDHYQNSLGKGLSDLLIKLSKKGLLGALLGWTVSEKLLASASQYVVSLSKRDFDQRESIIKMLSVFLKEKEMVFSLIEPTDQELVKDLFVAIENKNHFAEAAIWYPLYYHWGRLSKIDNYTVEVMMQRHLMSMVLPSKFEDDTLEKLIDAGLFQVADIDGYIRSSFDSRVGNLFEREVLGILGRPDRKTISSVPLQQQIRLWEDKKRSFELGQKKAIDLILKYRAVASEKRGYYFTDPKFVASNPNWVREFANEAISLPAFDNVMDFAKEPSKFLRYSESFHSFDGQALVKVILQVADFARKDASSYSSVCANTLDTLVHIVTSMYNLED